MSLAERAAREVAALEHHWVPVAHAAHVVNALADRMEAEARRFGMDRLPERPCDA